MKVWASCPGDFSDEIADKTVRRDIVDTDTVLDRHIDGYGIFHGFDTIRDECGLLHQAGTESAFLHPFGRTAAIQVDLVISPFLPQSGALRQIGRFASAQLQCDRMFFPAEVQMPGDIAVQQRTGRDHFRIKPGMAADQPVEVAAMPVCPVEHRGD